jgi:hypothetical protein
MLTRLTISDLAKATGLTVKQVRNLCEGDEAVIIPIDGGDGKGHFRVFSFMQAVGLAFLNRAGIRMRPDVNRAVYSFLSKFTEAKLCAEFRKGKVFLLPDAGSGDCLLVKYDEGDNSDHPFNLEAAYLLAKRAIEEGSRTADVIVIDGEQQRKRGRPVRSAAKRKTAAVK